MALARALVVEPDVLLLDEPLSNLDAKLRVRVRTELKEIQRSLGKTTILVTHDQEEALSISDRIAVMEAGRIRQTGTPIEVYARPADAFVADFVGIANFVPATVRKVGSDGVVLDTPIGLLTAPNAGGLTAGQCVTVRAAPHRTASLRDAPAWPSPGSLALLQLPRRAAPPPPAAGRAVACGRSAARGIGRGAGRAVAGGESRRGVPHPAGTGLICSHSPSCACIGKKAPARAHIS